MVEETEITTQTTTQQEEVESMPGHAIDTFKDQIPASINTKEDYNVVEGLFLGNKLYEEKEAVRIVGLAKIFDML